MVTFSATIQDDSQTFRRVSLGPDFEIVSSGRILHPRVARDISFSSFGDVAVAVDRQVIQHGRACILFEIHDDAGWEAVALWQDETRNFKVRSVDHAKLDEAKAWLEDRIEFCANTHPKKEPTSN